MFEYTQEHEEHKNNPRNMISITEYIISNWKHRHVKTTFKQDFRVG